MIQEMKVALLSHMFPNSIDSLLGVFVCEKARALSQFVDLKVIAPVSYFPYCSKILPSENEFFNGLNVRHPRYLALPALLWQARWAPYYFALKNLWGNQGPDIDVLHIEWIYPDAYAALEYAKKFNFKTVAVVHGNEAIGYFEKKSHRKKYIEALTGLDRIIAVSADLKRKLINEYTIREGKIIVIPNGVDLNKFHKLSQLEARHKLGLSSDRSIGVCVARLSPEKNLDVLIKAVSILNNETPEMYIIGDGPIRSKLESLIDRFSVKDKVRLVGPLPHKEIFWWLNAADVFCLPSQREGCPVVIHEALACGLPVISTTVGAIPDLINSEEYGLLCPPSDVQAFGSLLKKTMTMPWDREKIATYGRQFTWEAVAKQIVQVFTEVLE